MDTIDIVNKIGSIEEVLYFMVRMESHYLSHSMSIEDMERITKILHDKNITLDDYMYTIRKGNILNTLIDLEQEVGNTRFVKERLGVEY